MAEVSVGTVLNAAVFGKLMAGGWRGNPRLLDVGQLILSRAKYTCESCGFRSRPSKQVPHGYMVPVDQSHEAFLALDESRGKCLCPMCASVLGINWSVVGTVIGGQIIEAPGMLILQPAMSQVEINRLALHTLSIVASSATAKDADFGSAARDVDAAMVALNHEIGTSIPFYLGKDSDFARALALLPETHYQHRDEIIGHLRWWPNTRYWREQGLYWMQATYKQLHDSDEYLVEGAAK